MVSHLRGRCWNIHEIDGVVWPGGSGGAPRGGPRSAEPGSHAHTAAPGGGLARSLGERTGKKDLAAFVLRPQAILPVSVAPPPLPGLAHGLLVLESRRSLGAGLRTCPVGRLSSFGSLALSPGLTIADERWLVPRAPGTGREGALLCVSFSESFSPRSGIGEARAAGARAAPGRRS